MRRLTFLSAAMSLPVLLVACAADTGQLTVDLPESRNTPTIIGDGLEVRCYRITSSPRALHGAIIGMGGALRSDHELVLQGFEYYMLPEDRIDDFTSVISTGQAWNVRWIGQQFTWINLLPYLVPYSEGAFDGSLAMPGRAWSAMMEDGPVVYVEAAPVMLAQEGGTQAGRPLEQLRSQYMLRPGHAIILVGGSGMPLEDEIDVQQNEHPPLGPTMGELMMRGVNREGGPEPSTGQEAGNVLIFIPRFTSERQLPPLRTPL